MECLSTCVDWIEFRPCCFSCWARDIQCAEHITHESINIASCFWIAWANSTDHHTVLFVICELSWCVFFARIPLPLLTLSFTLYTFLCVVVVHATQQSVYFAFHCFHACVYRNVSSIGFEAGVINEYRV